MALQSSKDSLQTDLEHLKRQRAYKRGLVTKTERKIKSLFESHPDDWDPVAIDDLSDALSSAVTAHDVFQSQIDELLLADAAAYDLEQSEAEKHSELHSSLRLSLKRVRQQQQVWTGSISLVADLDRLSLITDKSTARFATKLENFSTSCRSLFNTPPALQSHPALKDRIQTFKKSIDEFTNDIESAASSATSSSISTSTSSTDLRPRMAPLNLEIPKYHGDPLQWEAFELELVSLLKHRAVGFSDTDKYAIIRQAIVPPQGKALVSDRLKSGASVDDLILDLRKTYGRPQLVIPILVQKIAEPPRTDQSATALRRFKESVLDTYRALDTHLHGDLGLFLPHFLRPFLDGKLREDWERLLFEKLPNPTMKDLGDFIEQRLLWADTQARPTHSSNNNLSSSSTSSSSTSHPTSYPPSSPKRKSAPPAKCASCGEAHWLGRCQAFSALDTDSRNRLVREKRLCLNCLSPAHAVRQCTNQHSCRHCSQRHHTLLHRDTRPNNSTPAAPPTAPSTVAVVDTPVHAEPASVAQGSGNFICTVVARLQHNGKITKARVLLDHGSGGSFMTEELATHLGLPRHPQDRIFEGFGQGTIRSKHKVFVPLASTTSTFSTNPIEFSICAHALTTSPPSDRDSVRDLATQQGLVLSDPEMGGKVDIILGEEHPWDLCGEVSRINRHRFIATEFGYGVVGPLASRAQVLTLIPQDTNLHDVLARLWSLDHVPEASQLTANEQRAVQHFKDTVILKDNRVTVALPFKQDPPKLGDTKRQALSRFFHNERSLRAKGKLEDFDTALREYIDLGHAHVVPRDQLQPLNPVYYMPVHGVFKDTSSTTKVRPVFDASAKSTTGASLNDCLLVGPNLYPQLADILLQFRQHPVGLSADISKMFREIRLAPDQQDLHRFILRQPDGQVVDCRMERVTFGVASSPFLATQTLRFIADHYESTFPRAAKLVRAVFYVDDFVSGAESIQEADSIRDELCGLLSKAGMTLRKWRSNSKEFLDHTPACLREVETAPLQLHESAKALGVHWNTTNDTLHVSVPPLPSANVKVTKRLVASISASVFDIMGLFAPTTIIPRTILQDTWKLHLPWDKELPDNLKQLWTSWVDDLPNIQSHAVPRQFFSSKQPHVFKSLHGFSDASTKAYGAAVYFRAVLPDGSIQTTLISAKARVLPTKHTTVPRAELLGAHLLARLLAHVGNLLDISHEHLFAWTDSAIVLHWLAKDSTQLRDRFVANRVQACHDLLPHTRWKHVRTEDNPADLASRGVAASDLVHSTLWWAGPQWLSEAPDSWPALPISRPPEAVQVLSISPSLSMETPRHDFLNELWQRFSSLHTLERTVAWIYRFFNRIRLKISPPAEILTSKEIFTSRNKLIQLSQEQDFPEVFVYIKQDKTLPKHHVLHKFLPTLHDGTLRLKSRVRDATSHTSPKLLTPLHPHSHFTRLLLHTSHRSYLHPGVAALQSIIADKFYVSGLRNILKKISRACPACQRAYARPLSQQLGMLPAVRTTPSPPFMKVGIDFAGPLQIRRGYTRKPLFEKCYVAVFVCMATKAIHLDLCASLSTEDFLATLTRFVSRRGCPSDIFSDNGSNFVGAREEIRELEALLGSRETKEGTSHFAQRNGISWHNIPPRAPHFGGLWEAAVRTMKMLLKKNLSPHTLRFDELYTLLAEAESILNSRPLTPILEDESNIGDVITAGHFLIGRPLRALPAQEPPSGKISTLRRWRLVSKIKHELWESWLKLYLATQHQRYKWTKTQQNLQVGDLVFVKDEVLKVRQWPLARIIKTFPGDDGQVRAVRLRCHGKEYTRAIQLLIPFTPDSSPSTDDSSTHPT